MQAGHGAASELDSIHANMFGGGNNCDFVFTIVWMDMKEITHGLLVFCGRDIFHPAETAREIACLAPHAQLVEEW